MLRRQIIPDNPARNKGIRSGHQEQIFEKEKSQQGIATYRWEGCAEKAREEKQGSRQKSKEGGEKAREKIAYEKGAQKAGQEVC